MSDTMCDCCEEQKATTCIVHTVDLCYDCAVEWGWVDEQNSDLLFRKFRCGKRKMGMYDKTSRATESYQADWDLENKLSSSL